MISGEESAKSASFPKMTVFWKRLSKLNLDRSRTLGRNANPTAASIKAMTASAAANGRRCLELKINELISLTRTEEYDAVEHADEQQRACPPGKCRIHVDKL